MRVLLVAPPVVRHTEHMPPYGVLALWWYVRRNFEVDFLDATHMEERDIVERAVQGYDVVGISGQFTATVHRAIAVAQQLKRREPGLTLVAGGAHATFDCEHFLRAGFDFVVRHEGELTLNELLERLQAGEQDFSQVQGLAFLRDDQLVTTDPRPLIEDLDSLPFPDLSELDLDRYRMASGERMFLLESSRGCCHKCKFCYTPAMWKRWRAKSAQRVAQEFAYYDQQGLEYLLVTDDNIAVNLRRIRELSEALTADPVEVPWEAAACQNSLARSPEIPRLLRAAGCETIQSAIDSGSQKVLDYYGKPTSRELMAKAFTAIREAGVVVNTQVIVGAPVESLRDAWSSLSFGRRWADVLTISTLEPRPGTSFWSEDFRDRFQEFGRGNSLLHPHPRAIEAVVIAHYLMFYLHPVTLRRALRGSGAQQRQLRWHMKMYSSTMVEKLRGLAAEQGEQDPG